MKKYFISIVLALIVIISCVCTVGCNNGFELVKSITITTNGEKKTFSSSTYPMFSMKRDKEITKEDYDSAPSDRKFSTLGSQPYSELRKLTKITLDYAKKRANYSTRYEVVEEPLVGYWYYTYTVTGLNKIFYHYMICEYDNTYFNFVYVKVKNDTTIAIRTVKNETTYTVSSYNIVKFE